MHKLHLIFEVSSLEVTAWMNKSTYFNNCAGFMFQILWVFYQMCICTYSGTLGKLFMRTILGGVCFRIIRCQVGCCRRVPSYDDPRFPDAM